MNSGTLNGVLNNVTGWINNLFSWGNTFVGGYSKLLVIGFLFLMASKIFKIKLDVKRGH